MRTVDFEFVQNGSSVVGPKTAVSMTEIQQWAPFEHASTHFQSGQAITRSIHRNDSKVQCHECFGQARNAGATKSSARKEDDIDWSRLCIQRSIVGENSVKLISNFSTVFQSNGES